MLNQSDKDIQKQTKVPGSKSIFKNSDKVVDIQTGRVTKPFLKLFDSRKEPWEELSTKREKSWLGKGKGSSRRSQNIYTTGHCVTVLDSTHERVRKTRSKSCSKKQQNKLTSALKNKPKTQQNKICHSDDVPSTDKTKGDLSEGCIGPSLAQFSCDALVCSEKTVDAAKSSQVAKWKQECS